MKTTEKLLQIALIAASLASASLTQAAETPAQATPLVKKFTRNAFNPGLNKNVDLTYLLKTDAQGRMTIEVVEQYYMDDCFKGVTKVELVPDELAVIYKITSDKGYCPVYGIGFNQEMTKGWGLSSKEGRLPTGKRLLQWVADGKKAPEYLPAKDGS